LGVKTVTKSSEFFSVERTNGTLVVVLGPRLSSFSGLLQERTVLVDEIRDSPTSAVILDFDKVEYFDSLFLDTLCQAWRHLRARGGKMALCNLRGVPEEIIRKCRLDALWPIYPSRQSAFDALASGNATQL
jgi:anti-anti-sigma factor